MKYEIYLDESSYNSADKILREEGLNMSTAINIFLKRIIKDKSIGFVFNKENQSCSEDSPLTYTMNKTYGENLSTPFCNKSTTSNYTFPTVLQTNVYKSDISSITKSIAKRLFFEKGHNISTNYTFSSENETSHVFWANPSYTVLRENWYLILNDKTKHVLNLFMIPADEIKRHELVMRNDNQNLIDLQIAYNDSTFTDNRSKKSFKPYFVDRISY